MKSDKLQDAVGLVRDDFVKDAEYAAERQAKVYPWVEWVAVAACLAIAVLIASFVWKEYAVLAGLFAILGHNYPLYYGFKGGKGVSTTFGILLAIDWHVGVIIGTAVLVLLFTTKIMSLSNLICFAFLPLTTYFINPGEGNINVYITAVFALLIYYTHRSNIKRLLNGTENKFGKKKSEDK